MNPLYEFLRHLSNRFSSNFIIEGYITSNNNVIRELNRFDPFCSVKFSLQIADPSQIINLIEVWAPRASAGIKQIHWRENIEIKPGQFCEMVGFHYSRIDNNWK